MKATQRLPDHHDWGVDVRGVGCPFCAAKAVQLKSMAGGAANELLMRCEQCKSFFYLLKDPEMLTSRTLESTLASHSFARVGLRQGVARFDDR